ncbi:hypothetical protein PPERSA_09654 [Pseudocohnilembus persalinus]|uniref:Ubiquitin carboxyl-terminal hydrolase n=1 Tax=Pseudocohnilembus persalinus TaxID=266149 RepID=A0A0V0R713_PSEPJ|nr:hypothetical protein PPERSA_09654 [Pseudocohnilembus persalinus]|eukprot:KRX10270.1 hypothetical protein PPERSA_09654 [Pseudocohnilembus persalinus]
MDSGDQNWLPLESNPEVINPYFKKMGFDTEKFQFQDLLSTDEWAQEMIKQPCLAVILLFPIKESTEKYDEAQQEKIDKEGQKVSENLFYMYQYAQNACGTIAAIHSILNGDTSLIKEGSILHKFYQDTKNLSPEERGKYFNKSESIKESHVEAVNNESNQTQAQDEVNTHFIAFIHKDGYLYEMDGRKKSPINHGETNEQKLLSDSCKVIKDVFMKRDPEELNFATMVLASPQEQ